jgi:hypothetical protein
MMNRVQNGDLTVGEPKGMFLDFCAVLGTERRPKVEFDAFEVLETWKGTEGLSESIFKFRDLEFITGALKANWKKTKLCMIAWIVDDLADVSGE